MSSILVVDDMPMCREPIAEALRGHGYHVTCAGGGREALEILRDQRPDLVLLDVSMPDPDGLTVLRIMRRNPNFKDTPVILLTDCAEKATVTDAAKCGVQGYLLKSNFLLDSLLERIEYCLGAVGAAPHGASSGKAKTAAGASPDPSIAGAGGVTAVAGADRGTVTASTPKTSSAAIRYRSLQDLVPVITKAKLTRLVNDGLKLRPLAATVHNVMAVTGSRGCSAADVAKTVATDQVLCIRLLKLANSSAYSRGRTVDSVQTAVQRIGIQEVRKLVMTLGIFDQYTESQSTRINMRLFWEHSIACGLIAAAIARECRFSSVDDCFLWGTVHDVGRLILLEHATEEYHQTCDAADELRLSLEVVESKMMLVDHCEILKDALEHWRFPREFIIPVANHHESVGNLHRLGSEHAQAAMIISLANCLAHALLLGCSGNEMIYPIDELVEALSVPPEVIQRVCAEIPGETRDLKLTMIVHSGGEEWPDFAEIVRQRLDRAIRPLCISRDPSVDAFRIFCDQITSHTDGGPANLGVIYLREPGEAVSLFAEYEAAEDHADCGKLPLMVICARGSKKLVDLPWRGRVHAVIDAPTSLGFLISSIQEVMSQVAPTEVDSPPVIVS